MSHDLMKRSHKRNTVVGALLALSMFSGVAKAADVTVDCTGATAGAFTSIGTALETLDRQGPHTILLLPGQCVELVGIIDRGTSHDRRFSPGFTWGQTGRFPISTSRQATRPTNAS